jgi:hypothetical protein
VPQRPQAAAHPSGWTGGRITAVVTGALLALVSLALLGAGGTVLWADTQRDDLPWIAAGLLAAGAVFAASGALLITGAIRRYRGSRASTV